MVLRKTQQSRKYFNATHYRSKNGRFTKRPQIEYYRNIVNGEWNEIPEYFYDDKGNREKITYRAVVTLNGVPEHSQRYRGGKEHYLNFSYVKIDYYENIDIQDLKNKLMSGIADYFHCNVRDLIYDTDGMEGIGDYWKEYACLFDIEMPKPYRGSHYEGLEEGHVHIF